MNLRRSFLLIAALACGLSAFVIAPGPNSEVTLSEVAEAAPWNTVYLSFCCYRTRVVKNKRETKWDVYKKTYKTQRSSPEGQKNTAVQNKFCTGTTSGWRAAVRSFRAAMNAAEGHSATCPSQ